MLDQLVESKSNAKENTRRSEFMIFTGILAVLIVLGLWTKDLFGHDYGMGGDDLELSTLVAPPPPDDTPPPPKPEKQPEKQPDVDVRKELIQNIMSSPIKPPDTTSVERNKIREMRENVLTKLGGSDSDTGAIVGRDRAGVTDTGGLGGTSTAEPTAKKDEDAPPEPIKKKEPPKTISGGVLNGKAVHLVTPPYPPAARAVRASGAVSVQVLIDETGRVVSASAANGHPLLRAAAESAARASRFSPTLLSGQPVKVSGIITYNFVP